MTCMFHVLRSSPAPEGRCWHLLVAGAHHQRRRVAILAGPGGPVLDERLEDRVDDIGVAILAGPGGPVLAAPFCPECGRPLMLRSSPAPEGRCWDVEVRLASDRVNVAILAGPGGPVLAPACTRMTCPSSCCDPRRPRRAGAGRRGESHLGGHVPVAILAGPGGPVLDHVAFFGPTQQAGLRSSPAPEGRCWHGPGRRPPGRQPRVAILAGPGGPVLAEICT